MILKVTQGHWNCRYSIRYDNLGHTCAQKLTKGPT